MTESLVIQIEAKVSQAEKDIKRLASQLDSVSQRSADVDRITARSTRSINQQGNTARGAASSVSGLSTEIRGLSNSNEGLDKSINRSLPSINQSATGMGLASTAALSLGASVSAMSAAMLVATARLQSYVSELKVWSTISGESTQNLQAMQFAVESSGVSMQEFADMSQSARERVGEFINEGSGEFTVLTDTLRLTKDESALLAAEFKNLSGQEILQRTVNLLEEAGKNGAEMSAVLEAMASGSTKLIPLLSDGGDRMRELSIQASSVTIPLTNEEIEAVSRAGAAAKLAGESFENYLNKSLARFSPLIESASTKVANFFATLNRGTVQNTELQINEIDSQIEELNKRLEEARDLSNASFGTKLIDFVKGFGSVMATTVEGPLPSEVLSSEVDEIQAKIDELSQKRESLGAELQRLNESISVSTGLASESKSPQELAQAEIDILNEKNKIVSSWEELENIKKQEKEAEAEKEKAEKLKELKLRQHEQEIEDIVRRAHEFTSTEEELLKERLAREIELVGENNEHKLLLQEEFNQRMAELNEERAKDEERQYKRDADIAKDAYDKKILSASSFISASRSINSAFFDDNKKLNQGLIVADTAAAVMRAHKVGGAPAAFEALAMGVAQLQALKSANIGSGSVEQTTATEAPQQQETATEINISQSDLSGLNQVITVKFDESTDLGEFLSKAINTASMDGRI